MQCIRRRAQLPSKVTPSAARATLTPEPSPSPAIRVNEAAAKTQPISEDPVDNLRPADKARIIAVRQQMEFWFSASNLRRDWYLRRQMDDEGWLDPATFLRFNRIKSLHATLHDIILACSVSDELEVSAPDSSFGDVEGQTRVRRSAALPDFREWNEEELPRSFILKRIPKDSTVESLQSLLEPLGSPSYVRIYRSKDPSASISALVCFEDVSTADAVFVAFAEDTRPEAQGIVMKRRSVSPDGAEQVIPGFPGSVPRPSLLICEVSDLPASFDWKRLYRDMTDIFLEKTGTAVKFLLFDNGSSSCHVTVVDNAATRSTINDFIDNGIVMGDSTCSVRLLQDQQEIADYWQLAEEHQAKRKARRQGKPPSDAGPQVLGRYPQGVIVQIEGFDEDQTWQEIKADLEQKATLVYLSFDRNKGSCHARFGSPEEARAVADSISDENGRQVCGVDVKAYVLYGEEEEEYWKRAEQIRKEKRSRL